MSATTKSRGSEVARPKTQPVTLGQLDNYIAFHLRLAQNASFNAFKRKAGEADLRPGRFAVMAIIEGNPGITPLALSRASGRDKSTITPVLRGLERDGLIARSRIEADRRSHALFLTPAGEAMLQTLTEAAAEHDRELDAIVGDKKHELIALLRRIVATLD
ncbi:MarR family transcriptional regulator [Jiella endophytica]|uniref:MarR family transcriptional regulator n=1 Tax=Jiella endophytica TaxID=2558362 RepID=A0A4Y8R7U5_9HYPH|nr:MarR family transcriptional regulator [Jiella endophytica]TFF17691.1 MarR family transcriptional regulator [Jiella endophytica]